MKDARHSAGRLLLPLAIRRGLTTIAAVFAIFLLASSPAFAKYASFVIDADSGEVFHSVNADTRNYPASLTKMMTLYLVFESLSSGEWTLDKQLKVSARAARQPASKLALGRGRTISVEDAILALVTKSANDVATVISENMSGRERDFALKMTAKARKLGMDRTNFRNASGLYNRAQLSTARDMATLARALLRDFPQYYHYFSTPTFKYAGLTHRNHNHLLRSYDGTDGIKTGYISASGFNLVASVERHGRRLIGVVFGGKSSRSRDKHMISLLDKAFDAVGKQAETRVASVEKAQPKPPMAIEPAPIKPTAPAIVASAAPSALGDWAVQVGAYRFKNPAYERAREAVETVPNILREGVIKVVPLTKKKRRPLYRARIAGLEKKQAYSACTTLERNGIDCLVVVMKGVQVAANR